MPIDSEDAAWLSWWTGNDYNRQDDRNEPEENYDWEDWRTIQENHDWMK